MKLHEIAIQHKELESLAEKGEFTLDELKDTFEMIEGDFKDKAVSLVAVKENMQTSIDALSNEIKRLQGIKNVIENKQDTMIDYLRYNMKESGITKIEHLEKPFFTITLRKAPKIVSVDDLDAVPTKYKKAKTTISPDKQAIAKALKSGEEVQGCSLVDGKQSVIIK